MRLLYISTLSSFLLISLLQSSILHTDGKPTQPLLDLLALTNVKHDGALATIVQATQKEWLRIPGKERWEMPEVYGDKKDTFFDLFHTLNVVNAIEPQQRYYRYAIVLGGLTSRMRNRMAYLVQQWNRGIRFEKIIFLAGLRLLDAQQESREILFNLKNDQPFVSATWQPTDRSLPTTEAEAAELAYAQVDMPEELRKVPVEFVTAPMITLPDGKVRRPATDETVKQWLSSSPQPGPCLAFSNQPFAQHQNSVLRSLLPATFGLETVGRQADDNTTIAVHLDNLARFLFNEQKKLAK